MNTRSNTAQTIAPMTLLRSFIDPIPIVESIARVEWTLRRSSYACVECPNPASHGKLSGQICEYFAQPQLLTAFSKTVNQPLSTFAGNIVRSPAKEPMSLSWRQLSEGDAVAALAVNIGTLPAQLECVEHPDAVVSINTGEAVLMSLLSGVSFKLSEPADSAYLIEGYYLRPR